MINKPVLTAEQAKDIVSMKLAPRVTEEAIEAKIQEVKYLSVADGGTLCIITMKNGWVSTGFSKAADSRNFDPEVGRRYAYDHAFRPLWQLEGYLLRERLHSGETS